jgi:chemotaxis signal transduction protein
MSGVSRNRGGFVKCVTIQKRLGIPDLEYQDRNHDIRDVLHEQNTNCVQISVDFIIDNISYRINNISNAISSRH